MALQIPCTLIFLRFFEFRAIVVIFQFSCSKLILGWPPCLENSLNPANIGLKSGKKPFKSAFTHLHLSVGPKITKNGRVGTCKSRLLDGYWSTLYFAVLWHPLGCTQQQIFGLKLKSM